ncbi:MAG TPA: histidine kinase [Acetobacteraceae bacterium]|jgi:CBS domain-containing protein|nr:histidine kinase [Acetobacteraceae bacterium]
MRASDVMTTKVITVSPDTTVQELATLLGQYGISGAPVVDADKKLIGIVSEGDLLFRTETATQRRTEKRRTRWFDLFAWERDRARDYVKSHSHNVGDLMTTDVITVSETTELEEIANLFETKRIKRVPVVRDGQVVGIVSRANLVRALVAAGMPAATATDADDRTIRRQILAELQGQDWARVWADDVIVRDGVVHIWSSDDRSDAERKALRVAAENTAGVRGVEEHIVAAPMASGII